MILTEHEWMKEMDTDARGNILNTLSNIVKIFENDSMLKNIVFNEMSGFIDTIGELPWNKNPRGWGQNEMACLELYLEKKYGIYAPSRCRDALTAYLTTERRFHPIKNYLDNIRWDGKARLDKLLIDYLKADDCNYTKMVTRKTLTAAIARVYEPGIKFDYILVLCGMQGIGKSTLFSMLGGPWYSDSMTISDMKDKTASEKLQGIWIMELGELAGIRKVDVEIVKSFITRQNDIYRPPYGQYVENHWRTCIIVGTTNADNGFLRDISGNRRFWPVKLKKTKEEQWRMSELDVDQIWAEAYQFYKKGETLYLSVEDEKEAEQRQREELEVDPRAGVVEEYLSAPQKTDTCLMEIWCDCLGRSRNDMKKRDAYELEAILKRIGNWELYSGNNSGKKRTKYYGIQRVYVRKTGDENEH